jgi:hypothetical protein
VELTIAPEFLGTLIFWMRAVMLDDRDLPKDMRNNLVAASYHITLDQDVGHDMTRQVLMNEIDDTNPDHPQELVVLMWVGRGDFGAEDWDEAHRWQQSRQIG